MIGFVFLFCLLFRWGSLRRMLLMVGWCCWWSCIPGVSFAWVLTVWYLRVSSLVSGVLAQCSPSKVSGLDLKFYVGLYILFCWSDTPVCSGVLHALLCLRVYSWGREMYSTLTYSSAILFSPWIKQFFSRRIEKAFVWRFGSSKFFQVELIDKVFSSYKPWTPLHGRALLAWASS